MLSLRDIMTRDVVSVSPELPLDELVELFTSRHIGGAPVVSGDKLVGVVSASDVLTFALAITGRPRTEDAGARPDGELGLSGIEAEELPAGYFTALWEDTRDNADGPFDELSSEGRSTLYEFTVADVMSADVLSLDPDTDVVAAADFMRRKGIHRVLVVKDGELRGIASSMDIVTAVAARRIPEPRVVAIHEVDFDSGWSHEPLIPDIDRASTRSD